MLKLNNYFSIQYTEIHFFKSVQNLTEIKDNPSKSSKNVLINNLFKFYVLNDLNFFKIKNIWFPSPTAAISTLPSCPIIIVSSMFTKFCKSACKEIGIAIATKDE